MWSMFGNSSISLRDDQFYDFRFIRCWPENNVILVQEYGTGNKHDLEVLQLCGNWIQI